MPVYHCNSCSNVVVLYNSRRTKSCSYPTWILDSSKGLPTAAEWEMLSPILATRSVARGLMPRGRRKTGGFRSDSNESPRRTFDLPLRVHKNCKDESQHINTTECLHFKDRSFYLSYQDRRRCRLLAFHCRTPTESPAVKCQEDRGTAGERQPTSRKSMLISPLLPSHPSHFAIQRLPLSARLPAFPKSIEGAVIKGKPRPTLLRLSFSLPNMS